MPPFESFRDAESFYGTPVCGAAHPAAHENCLKCHPKFTEA
jgi:antirestriction protein ArdC